MTRAIARNSDMSDNQGRESYTLVPTYMADWRGNPQPKGEDAIEEAGMPVVESWRQTAFLSVGQGVSQQRYLSLWRVNPWVDGGGSIGSWLEDVW